VSTSASPGSSPIVISFGLDLNRWPERKSHASKLRQGFQLRQSIS
jgi:hypothetical protein